MQRGPARLLLHLAQRAPLARAALPLLAAFAPEAIRSLHVFARRPHADHVKVDVRDGADAGDLKDAVCAKLKLDAPPDTVRLLRKVAGGGAPVPLDSRRTLAEQGVCAGSSVIVEPLHPPLHSLLPTSPYALVRLHGSLAPTTVVLPPGADAHDLAEAALAELKIDVAPHQVRLLREVSGGGAPVPLDSRRTLAEQGVYAGASVLLEVLLPDLPPPLHLTEELLGGERAVIADLNGCPGFEAFHPFFLTPPQLATLQRFLQPAAPPADLPALLVVSGTAKSGKTRILSHIIPRLLSLYYSQAQAAAAAAAAPPPRRPVIFHVSFTHFNTAEEAAERWLWHLRDLAAELGVTLPPPPAAAHDAAGAIPGAARKLARRVHVRGAQLWLLHDELSAPLLASEPAQAAAFMRLFRDTLQAAAPYARAVATGSGMVSLLHALSVTAAAGGAGSGPSLLEAAAHLRVGQAPAPALALAMAQRLHSAYSVSWQKGYSEHITPQRLVDSLGPHGALAGLATPRPCLLSFLASYARNGEPAPDRALQWALALVRSALHEETWVDVVVGLERMGLRERQALRRLAEEGGGARPSAHPLSAVTDLLCCETEGGGQQLQRLLPPYLLLLRRWLRRDGVLAVCRRDLRRVAPRVQWTLRTLHRWLPDLDEAVARSASRAVLLALAEYGIGVAAAAEPAAPAPATTRAPATVAELLQVPLVALVLGTLERTAVAESHNGWQLSLPHKAFKLAAAAAVAPAAQEAFLAHAGLAVLQLLHCYQERNHSVLPPEALACGLTEAALDYAAHTAAHEVVAGGKFGLCTHGALLNLYT